MIKIQNLALGTAHEGIYWSTKGLAVQTGGDDPKWGASEWGKFYNIHYIWKSNEKIQNAVFTMCIIKI